MSTFIIHLLIPALMAQAVRLCPARYVWAWVWVSVGIDLDYLGWILFERQVLAVNFHRALFHNIFFPLVLTLYAVYAFRRFANGRVGSTWQLFTEYAQTWNGAGSLLAPYYFYSHVLLDMSQGGVALFFPLSLFIGFFDFTAFYHFNILVDTAKQEPVVEATAASSPGVVDVSPVYLWMSSEEFAFLMLFATVLALAYLHRRIGAREAARAEATANQP